MMPEVFRRRRRGGVGVAPAAITDTFTRADSATSLGTADTGQAWTVLAGTWGISSNQAYEPASGGGNQDAAVIDTARSDCTVQVTFTTTANNQRIGFRYTDVNNGFIVNNEGSQYNVYRLQAGTYTSIATYVTTAASGDVVKVVLGGSSITLFVNGTLGVSVTDAFNATATKHGIGNNAGTTVRWDTFSVT